MVILVIAAVWAGLGAARAAAADGDALVTPTGGCAIGATDVWTVTGVSLALYVPLGLAALWATGELTDVFSIRFEFMWSGAGLLLALAVHVAIAYAYSGYGDGGGGAQGYGTAAHALVGGGYVYLVLSLWVPVALSFSASFAATNRAIEQRALAEGARAGGGQRSVFDSARIKAMAAGEGDDGALAMPGGKRSSQGAGAPRRISAYEAVSAALDAYQRIRRSFHLSHITQSVGPDQLVALCRELAEQARAGKLLRVGGEGAGPMSEKGSVEGPSELGGSGVMDSGSRRSHTTGGSTGSSFEVGAGMAGSRAEQAGSGSFLGHTILAEAEASSMLAGLAGAMTGRRGVLQLAQARCPASLEASTLADLLSHRPLYTRFRDYLKSEFSTENLLFFEQATVLEIGLVERLVQRGLVWGPGDAEPRARTEAYFVAVTGEEEKGGSTQVGGGAAAAAAAGETEGKDGSGSSGSKPLRRSRTSGELKAAELPPADQAEVGGDEDGDDDGGEGEGEGKGRDDLQRKQDESKGRARARRHSVDDKQLGSQGGLGSRSSRLEVQELEESREAGDGKGGSKPKGLADRMDTDEEALQALRKASRANLRGSRAGSADGGARQGAMSLRHMKGIPADLRLMLGGITHVAQRGVRAMFSSLLRSMKQAAARGWLPPEGQDLEHAKREVAEYLTGGTRAVTERFVKPGSPLEVNISSSQRRAVLRAMKKGSPGPGVLVPAKREIRRLMQMDSLPRFRAQAQQGTFFKKYQRKFQAMLDKLEKDAEERKQKKLRQEGSKV